MRWEEIAGGLRIVLTNEEGELCDKVEKDEPYSKKKLTDREKETARKLVSKGILTRSEKNNDIRFRKNNKQKLRRT